MKKRFIRLLSLSLSVPMLFSAIACGKANEKSGETTTALPEVTTVTTAQTTAATEATTLYPRSLT